MTSARNLRFGINADAEREQSLSQEKRIVAVALLTAADLKKLGPSFHRAYPVDETPCFGALLRAIDEADREMRRDRSTR